ncbi:hypothetical protein THAOC_09321, partial [Thalassiosira oceanica]
MLNHPPNAKTSAVARSAGLQYVALLQVVEDDLHLCAGAHEESDGEDNYAADLDRWGEEGGTGSYLSELVPNQGGTPAFPRGSGPGLLRGERGPSEAVNVLDPASGNNSTGHQPGKKEDEGPREINVTPSHGVPTGAVLVRDQGPRGPDPHDSPRRRQVRRRVQRRPEGGAGAHHDGAQDGGQEGHGQDRPGLRELRERRRPARVHQHAPAVDPPRGRAPRPHRRVGPVGLPPADESAAGLAFLLMLFGRSRPWSTPADAAGGGSGGDVLEMRDKTDSPYARLDSAEDELGGSLHPDADGGGGAGGGLDEPLLPSKDDGGDGRSPTWARLHSTSCSICLDDYAPGEQVRVLPCGHTFHGSCIFPWLTERSPTCPLCKGEFLFCFFAGSDASSVVAMEGSKARAGFMVSVEERIFEFGMRPLFDSLRF